MPKPCVRQGVFQLKGVADRLELGDVERGGEVLSDGGARCHRLLALLLVAKEGVDCR